MPNTKLYTNKLVDRQQIVDKLSKMAEEPNLSQRRTLVVGSSHGLDTNQSKSFYH